MHIVVALALAASSAGAAQDATAAAAADWAAYEANVLAALEARAPASVPEARAAGQAYASQRWDDAIAGYRRVLEAAPGFSHALRRTCNAQLALGATSEAVASCRAAVAADPLPENMVALSRAILVTAGDAPERSAVREASSLAHDAIARMTKPDRSVTTQLCDVALRTDDRSLLSWCSGVLLRIAAGSPEAHYFAAIDAATSGEFGRARAELKAARAAGLPDEVADGLQASFDDSDLLYRYGRPALWGVGAWAATLLGLVLLGRALSAATLRAAARLARAPGRTDSAGSRALRRAYGAVLWASCAFYYASVPLSFFAVLALGLGVFWAFSFLGEIPVQIVLALAVVILVTAWAVLKSLWVSLVRPREIPDPGARLAPGTHPALDRVVRSVAERLGTRPVDAAFLTPGAEVAVFERGGVWRQLAGRAERCLILGAGVFDGMTQGELKAVLAHEYGHLVNRDTAGGGFALTVRRSILAMAETLAEGGAATWYNPAWWFVRGFYLVFLRISQGASRLQEVLADRWAAVAYGGEAFARGLEHAVAQSVRFDRHVARTLREVLEGERSLANVYRYVPAEQEDPEALSAAIAQALDAEPSAYDSHPRARDRIAWTAGIPPAGSLELDDDRPVWSLFADRYALEREMTDQLRLVVAERNGVTIPSEDAREGAREDAVA